MDNQIAYTYDENGKRSREYTIRDGTIDFLTAPPIGDKDGLISTVDELRCWSRQQHDAGKRVGFVPTMGALHEGHLSLVRAANERCDVTLVSIFVNPTQFGANEDFAKYPRSLEQDLKLLQTVGSPEVFVPSATEMCPSGFGTTVHIDGITELWEGISRPTHFDGVATVVLKLFLMSGADVAFFGQKDLQQVRVVEKMVADLNVPIEIVVCPIVREADGLAMSSRNRYLTPNQREQALVLSRSLDKADELFVSEPHCEAEMILYHLLQTIATAPDAKIDYVDVVDPQTLWPLQDIGPILTPEVAVLLAVKFGDTRLIDNRIYSLPER